jgi:hypothetical protein
VTAGIIEAAAAGEALAAILTAEEVEETSKPIGSDPVRARMNLRSQRQGDDQT